MIYYKTTHNLGEGINRRTIRQLRDRSCRYYDYPSIT